MSNNQYFLSKLEPVLYVVIAIIIVLATNIGFIADSLFEDGSQSFHIILDYTGATFRQLLTYIDSLPSAGTIVILLFWFIFGQLLITVIHHLIVFFLTINTIIHESSNDYIHPKNFSQSAYWKSQIIATMKRSFMVLLGGVLLAASVFIFIPFSSACVRTAVAASRQSLVATLYFFASIIVATLMVAIWAVYLRFIKFR